jgi:hypothetical protein
MDDVRERLEQAITQSSVDMWFDGEDCYFDVTQENYKTGNKSTWSFVVNFGVGTVTMFEPQYDSEHFGNDNEVFEIIKSFLNGGMSREKRRNIPNYDYGEPIKIKIGNSRKPIKSAKSVCVGFNTENGTLLWRRDDLYTLDGSTVRQTKRQDIADRWIEKYDLNTTDERRLDRFTQEGPSQIPWGLPLVEDKDQTNYNKKLASILPPHNLDSSFNKRNSEKELTGKQKNDFIKKAMKMQGYNDKEANQMVNQSREVR